MNRPRARLTAQQVLRVDIDDAIHKAELALDRLKDMEAADVEGADAARRDVVTAIDYLTAVWKWAK